MAPSSQGKLDSPEALGITARQLELLQAIHRWSGEHGRMPSVRELGEVLDRAASTVYQHLAALERRGCIERTGLAHGIRLTVDSARLNLAEAGAGSMLPLKGFLSPGRQLMRSKTPYPRLPAGGESRRGDYLLQLMGDRLESDGMFDGDLMVVRPGSAGENPAVVQFPDGTADIRRVTTLRDGSLALLPPRPRLENRRGARRAPDGLLIHGRVLRVIRSFE